MNLDSMKRRAVSLRHLSCFVLLSATSYALLPDKAAHFVCLCRSRDDNSTASACQRIDGCVNPAGYCYSTSHSNVTCFNINWTYFDRYCCYCSRSYV